MVGDILYDPKSLYLFILYGLAMFFIAELITDFCKDFWFRKSVKVTGLRTKIGFKFWPFARIDANHLLADNYIIVYPFDFKPLNCNLCLIGWLSIFTYIFSVQLEYLAPFAVAGAALLIWKLKERLGTFVL